MDDCKICAKTKAKYNCPRCNIVYCSADCYQSQRHQGCSEGFFRENVAEELALRQREDGAAKSTRKMLEMLQRVERTDSTDEDPSGYASEADSDDEQECDLAARLNGVDLDDASSVWNQLTSLEKDEFQKMVNNGDIIQLLPRLNCWWTREYKIGLIQPVEGPSEETQKLLLNCPEVWDKIPNIEDLYKKEPSPMVCYSIANVLAAYSFVYRYFYGDIHKHALEATDCFISIALTLKNSTVFDSVSMAVESVTNECIQEKLPTDRTTTSILEQHVSTFIAGPNGCGTNFKKLFLLSALSDVRSLLCRADTEFKELNQRTDVDKSIDVDIRDLKHIEGNLFLQWQKKIEFFLAYASSCFFFI